LKNDLNARTVGGLTPFFIACSLGYADNVKLCLSYPQLFNYDQPCNVLVSPFFAATGNGYHEVMKLLLDSRKVDPNQLNNKGGNPVFTVCGEGNVELLKLLLEYDHVNFNVAGKGGCTPL